MKNEMQKSHNGWPGPVKCKTRRFMLSQHDVKMSRHPSICFTKQENYNARFITQSQIFQLHSLFLSPSIVRHDLLNLIKFSWPLAQWGNNEKGLIWSLKPVFLLFTTIYTEFSVMNLYCCCSYSDINKIIWINHVNSK